MYKDELKDEKVFLTSSEKIIKYTGNKQEFIHLMISNRLGPFQLFGEIIYYMRELINNLVSKDYNKYKNL